MGVCSYRSLYHCERKSYMCMCVLFFIYFPVTRTKRQWLDTPKLEVQTAEPGDLSGFMEGGCAHAVAGLSKRGWCWLGPLGWVGPGDWKEAAPCSDICWQQVAAASGFPVTVGSGLDAGFWKTCHPVILPSGRKSPWRVIQLLKETEEANLTTSLRSFPGKTLTFPWLRFCSWRPPGHTLSMAENRDWNIHTGCSYWDFRAGLTNGASSFYSTRWHLLFNTNHFNSIF